MPVVPNDFEIRVKKAVAHYWTTLDSQGTRQRAGDADRGSRAAVVGGKQMDGFCELVSWLVAHNGMPDASIIVGGGLELPGYFRPTKKWDLLVVHRGHLVAATEFKSQAKGVSKSGSFGSNYNNRCEEALGNAVDIWTAFREGAFGLRRPRPWVGWLMCLEDCDESTRALEFREPHFKIFEDFRDHGSGLSKSYAQRYEILLRRLMLEKHYDGAALLLSTKAGGPRGDYHEPAADLAVKRFLAGLGGHIQTFLASE